MLLIATLDQEQRVFHLFKNKWLDDECSPFCMNLQKGSVAHKFVVWVLYAKSWSQVWCGLSRKVKSSSDFMGYEIQFEVLLMQGTLRPI